MVNTCWGVHSPSKCGSFALGGLVVLISALKTYFSLINKVYRQGLENRQMANIHLENPVSIRRHKLMALETSSNTMMSENLNYFVVYDLSPVYKLI